MTIAVGMSCTNGVVIAADTQMSLENFHKYHGAKVNYTDGPDWALVFSYAGDPDLYTEARDKIANGFRYAEERTPQALYSICDEVFTGMGRHFANIGLDMLIGVSFPRSEARLLTFIGKALNWEGKIRVLGVGDSSLTRFLSDALYARPLSTDDGRNIAIYVIAKAIAYVDHCGGDTDVCLLGDRGKLEVVSRAEVSELVTRMETEEKRLVRKIALFP